MILSELFKFSKENHLKMVAQDFWPEDRNIPELVMLIVSELGEAMESHRKGRKFSMEAYTTELVETDDFKHSFEMYVKDTPQDELADVFIRLSDFLGYILINHSDENKLYSTQTAETQISEIYFRPITLNNNFGESLLELVKQISILGVINIGYDNHVVKILKAFKTIYDIANKFGYDLDFHVREKADYNATRPKKHGKLY